MCNIELKVVLLAQQKIYVATMGKFYRRFVADLVGISWLHVRHADYEPVKKLQGFAYYVVEKEGQPTLVKNTKYKTVPEASIENYKG